MVLAGLVCATVGLGHRQQLNAQLVIQQEMRKPLAHNPGNHVHCHGVDMYKNRCTCGDLTNMQRNWCTRASTLYLVMDLTFANTDGKHVHQQKVSNTSTHMHTLTVPDHVMNMC